ncbi:SMC-Scp complex subunit ScpB [Candidatus Woesearchaeota archaeon]|nr:SMC-Scp complex subunit ScpB [Candidatus Woesearchaeota archaeon]
MMELKKPSVKSKVEAVLFSTGNRISLEEISKLCRSRKEDVISSLKELQKEYDEKQSSLMLVEEGEFWKFTVRDHFISMVRKIVTETELTKSVLETLSVIAFKYPILQSDLIKIRTNKAYEHLAELEKSGYISRQKHGRTNLIKLTEKFFRYFDLTEEKLKEQFKDFESIAKAIKEKEEEVDKIKEEQRKRAEELKKEDEKIKKEIESLDEAEEEFGVPLKTYEAKSKELISEDARTEFGTIRAGFEKEGNLIVEKEKIGEMEIIEEEQKPKPKKEKQIPYMQPQKTEQAIQSAEQQPKAKQKKKSEGIKMTSEMEAIVDKKVEQIIGAQKESKEENKEV